MPDPSSSIITVTGPDGRTVTIEVKGTGFTPVQLARLVVDGGLSAQGIGLRRLDVQLSESVNDPEAVKQILGQDPTMVTPAELVTRVASDLGLLPKPGYVPRPPR